MSSPSGEQQESARFSGLGDSDLDQAFQPDIHGGSWGKAVATKPIR